MFIYNKELEVLTYLWRKKKGLVKDLTLVLNGVPISADLHSLRNEQKRHRTGQCRETPVLNPTAEPPCQSRCLSSLAPQDTKAE